jgi:Uma2 family endonuclease
VNVPHPDCIVDAGPHVQKGFEWIGGHAVEKPAKGAECAVVAMTIASHLGNHVAANNLGSLLGADAGYRINGGSAQRVRKVTLSFVTRGRFPGNRPPRGNSPIPPDLAVELVSPTDTAEDIESRVADFMSVGVRLFGVVYPASRSVWVLRADGSAARLTGTQPLSGEDVVPGFSRAVADLFQGV